MKLQFHCDESKQAAIGAMPFSFQQMETETFGLRITPQSQNLQIQILP